MLLNSLEAQEHIAGFNGFKWRAGAASARPCSRLEFNDFSSGYERQTPERYGTHTQTTHTEQATDITIELAL